MSESWPTVDPLGEALHVLRMNGMYYSRCEFTAPWGLELPEMPGTLMFHVVTTGSCWLEVDGVEPRQLQPGSLGLVPHGDGHRLVSEPGTTTARLFDLPRQYLSERYEVIAHGRGGAGTGLVCGTVRFDHPAARHLISLLPRVIEVESWSAPESEWLAPTLRFMAAEAKALQPGGETVITRLADILVIQAIRDWLARDPGAQSGWLGALHDQQIGRSIALIHRDPTQPWTVSSLAAAAAMSRSAFAARFTSLVGEPPLRYVTRWRMSVALTWLQEEDATVAEAAHRLGYESEAAFSRTFKRVLGMSPGAARRGFNANKGRLVPLSAAE